MSQKIIITKPYGYHSLDDASELKLKSFNSYKKLLQKKNYGVVFSDLKDLEEKLFTEECGLVIAEVPTGIKEQKINALAAYIDKIENYFIKKQLILISDEEGFYTSKLMDAFVKHGTFLYVKPVLNENGFLETIDNSYKIYLNDNLIRYFRIGPVSRKFEEYLIKEVGDPDTGPIKQLQKGNTYFLPSFQLSVEQQELFTSVERYLNVYIEPSEFNKLNIELLEYKLDYEDNNKEKINIQMCVKEAV